MIIKRLKTVSGQFRPKLLAKDDNWEIVTYPMFENQRVGVTIYKDTDKGEEVSIQFSREEIESLYHGLND